MGEMKCKWPPHQPDCPDEVVAIIGIPGPRMLPVCQQAFDVWRKSLDAAAEKPATVEPGELD